MTFPTHAHTDPYTSADPSLYPSAGPAPYTPHRIGPYEVFQLLGEGGMGQVYLARSPGARLVAVKVVRAEYAETPDFRGRFRREADAARRVSGFFTPPVLDADADAERPWLATAYVPAPSLHEVVQRYGTLPEPALRALGSGLGEALLAIHTAGVVHRDLKPANVLVTDDGPRVIDFGISRAADATQVTRTGAVIGTPGYMAPEQIVASREAGPPADVFALGCVLAHAATGAGPFGAGTSAEVLYRAVHAPPRLDGVPATLHPLLAACLDKDPARRPSVQDVLAALGSAEPAALLTPGLREDLAAREAYAAALLTAPPVPATLPGGPAATGAPPGRRRFLAFAAGGTVLAGTAAGGGAFLWSRRDRPAADPGPGTTVRPSTPAVAPAPKPLWTRRLAKRLDDGRVGVLDGTVVYWNRETAVGHDAATGAPRWTAAPRLPSDVDGTPEWFGVHGSLLLGSARGDDREYLVGLDARGALRFAHVVSRGSAGSSAESVNGVFCVVGSVAVLNTLGDHWGVRAVDLAKGTVLWARTVKGSDYRAASDGRTCFLLADGDLLGLDLRSGAVRWTTKGVARPGDYPKVSVGAGAVLLTGVKVRAYGAADGRARWTAVNETTNLDGTAVVAGTGYVADGQDTVFALDLRDGRQKWHTPSPLNLAPGGGDRAGPAASASLVAIPTFDTPGVMVFRASDGRPLWARRAAGAETASTGQWSVRAVGPTVYAASSTTLYAFRSET
ncbi:protein kinase [Streptomyces sp. NPDC048604]|uniref:serine/threonine-protein kinase n=1 Tax=Streptomyces sp. NPDC048604 TaxID=3365578 RepID=UPI00371B6D52